MEKKHNWQALERFPRISQVKTLQFAKKSFGKHWESDQDVVTARLLRCFSRDTYLQCVHKSPQLRTWSSWGPTCWNGPHLVLIKHKRSHFPYSPMHDISQDLKVCYPAIKWRNTEITTSILFNMHLVAKRLYDSSTIMNLRTFVPKGIML